MFPKSRAIQVSGSDDNIQERGGYRNREEICKKSQAVGTLSKMMRTRSTSWKTKTRTVIQAAVLYGCEIKALNKKNIEELEKWERKLLCNIYCRVKR